MTENWFNLERYANLLRSARERGYKFYDFDYVNELTPSTEEQLEEQEPSSEGLCLLRHDIDADLAAAATMARNEYEAGVSSTYFLMWRSPCYNLMSRKSQYLAESILDLGHKIGLHYDQGYDAQRGYTKNRTIDSIEQQADWLERLLGCRVAAVSFHQPSRAFLQAGLNCGTRVNTYDKKRLRNFRYLSDSNRNFPLWTSFSESTEPYVIDLALAECHPQNIQLLIHPMWWVYSESSTENVWNRVILSNFSLMQDQLVSTERAFGQRRTFTLTQARTW